MTTTVYTASVNGVALNQDAFNFPTREGRLNAPTIRGADVEGVAGPDIPRSHWYGPKAETWSMWVGGREFDRFTLTTSAIDTGLDGFTRNLNYLKGLFLGNPSAPLALAKNDPEYGALTATGRCTDVTVGDVFPGSGFARRVQFDIVIPGGVWRMPAATITITAGVNNHFLDGNGTIEPDLIEFGGATDVNNDTTVTGFDYTGGASTLALPSFVATPPAALSSFFPRTVRPLRLAGGLNQFTTTGAGASVTYRGGVI